MMADLSNSIGGMGIFIVFCKFICFYYGNFSKRRQKKMSKDKICY